jgi:RHS repeat-associated protein
MDRIHLTNTYNGDGNRIEQYNSHWSMVYTYEGGNILYEKNLTSSKVTRNYYADGLLLAQTYGSSTYYLIDDAMGNTRAVTTSTDSTVFSSDYKPYGLNSGLSSSLSTFNFEYTHKPYDSTTGLYYYGARYYGPTINRFITEDTTKGSLQNPVTLNRYAYASDNPLAVIDPTGNSGLWGSFTSWVSNSVNTVSSDLTSAATDISHAWNKFTSK